MKIGVITAVWKRPEIFEMFAKCILEIKKNTKHELLVIVAGSELHESEKLVTKYGFAYIEIKNNPVSNKFSAALKRAEQQQCDYVLLMGSDNMLSLDLWKHYEKAITDKIDFFGLKDLYFYDTVSKRAAYWGGYIDERKGKPCGAGRLLSKKLLNKINWKLWKEGLDKGLDNSMEMILRNVQYTRRLISLKENGVHAIDVKSEINITKFKLWENTSIIDSTVIKNKFPCIFSKNNNSDFLNIDGNIIHKTAIIHDNVIMGKGNRIGAYTVIGSNGEIRGVDHDNFEGCVEIGDNNTISEFVTIHRSFKDRNTKIGNNNIIMVHCHLGHNVVIGNDYEICAGTILAGYATVKSGSKLKIGVLVRNRKTIGFNVIIGMGGVVVSDVKDNAVIVGNPAKQIKSKE